MFSLYVILIESSIYHDVSDTLLSAQYSDNFIRGVLLHLQHSEKREWEAEKCSTSDVL